MKHCTALILLVAAAFQGGCNRESKKVIAVIPKGTAHQFWHSVHAGAVKASRETGVDIIWNGPAKETDYAGQIQLVDAMINRRVDAIVVAPVDKKGLVGVVDRANREKIPVGIFDSGIDTDKFVTQVATDNFHAGEIAADRIGALLNGKGKVGMVAVQPGSASTMAREEGFEKRIQSAFPGIQIVAKEYGWSDYAKSIQAAENMLTAHHDIEALFASNESSAVGAAQALKGREGKIKLVGFDASPALLDGVKSGVIDSVVVQDPFRMGYEVFKSMVASIKGESVKKVNDLPALLVNRENLNTPEVQAQVNPDLKKWLD